MRGGRRGIRHGLVNAAEARCNVVGMSWWGALLMLREGAQNDAVPVLQCFDANTGLCTWFPPSRAPLGVTERPCASGGGPVRVAAGGRRHAHAGEGGAAENAAEHACT